MGWGSKPKELPNDRGLKKKYAKLLLSLDPFDAAKVLYPNSLGDVLQVSSEWVDDPIVNAYKNEYETEGNINPNEPDEKAVAREVWKSFQESKSLGMPDASKYAKLYCDIKGFIKRPDTLPDNAVDESKIRADLFEKKKFENSWGSE